MSDSPPHGVDPDDLAAMVCAALRMRGSQPSVALRVDEGRIVSIEVKVNGRLVATFPCQAFTMDEAGRNRIAKEIEGR